MQAGVGAANQTLYQHISKYVAGVRGHLNGLWRRILSWARNIANTAVSTPDMAAGAHWIAHTAIVAANLRADWHVDAKKEKAGPGSWHGEYSMPGAVCRSSGSLFGAIRTFLFVTTIWT